jgi:dynein light intermediate chain 2
MTSTVADNIWELAIAQQKQKVKLGSAAKSSLGSERNLLVVGSKSVGKTTLIHRFVERTETPKPTLALEYTFGRKNNQHLARVSLFKKF